ncbi:MAG: type II toxin-antitoxin system VapC family toxin [Deltaproteobacteria bacterium]|nr:type II toxin-antitoxin system VapC family toxin [Deltaproteobacteria bacterium]
MKILMDTQCWLWIQVSPERFSKQALDFVQDPDNDLLLSAASCWEIAIKYVLGRLPLPLPPSEYVPNRMEISGVSALPVRNSHALHVATLPAHHRDPFDRLLIAQAQLEKLSLLTADQQFAAYDVELHWAN